MILSHITFSIPFLHRQHRTSLIFPSLASWIHINCLKKSDDNPLTLLRISLSSSCLSSHTSSPLSIPSRKPAATRSRPIASDFARKIHSAHGELQSAHFSLHTSCRSDTEIPESEIQAGQILKTTLLRNQDNGFINPKPS